MKKLIIIALCLAAVTFLMISQSGMLTTDEEENIEEPNETSPKVYSEFYKKLINGEVTRIKLIGDSITAGVGAQYHIMPEDNPIIFDNEEEVYREAGYQSNSWANMFRQYMNRNFPHIAFINAGISGKSAKWANEHKEDWVANEDVVFVMLGTNDRWDSSSIGEFKDNLISFLSYVEDNSEHMIVMSPPPALTDNNHDKYHFGIEEVNQAIQEITQENNYELISHYAAITNFAANQGIGLEQLLQTTGSHPIDTGYGVIWRHIKTELTLYDSEE